MTTAAELTITGRLVGGHPMDFRVQTDNKTGLPRKQLDGVTPMTQAYVGIAIAKGNEEHWNQTEWGAIIYQAGVAGWPAGEHQAPDFAWKITDGDSTIPNKKGRVPNQREGWAGHWVVGCSTSLEIKCYHAGKFSPNQQIQNNKEIKPGDYCRVLLNVKGNAPSQSPGVYLNPTLFELSRAGIQIVLDNGASAEDAFGGTTAQLPQNAQLDPNAGAQTAATAATAPPHHQQPPQQKAPQQQTPASAMPAKPAADFVDGPGGGPAAPILKWFDATGAGPWTREQLIEVGHTDQSIALLNQAP